MNVAQKLDTQTTGFAMYLREAAEAIGARSAGEDVLLQGVSTDTRNLQPGQLFVALHGPNFDGHAYLDQAKQRGAAACMVEHAVPNWSNLIVEDTRRGLGYLARAWRRRFNLPLVAVTGSNGKTTVKEMIATILSRRGETLATQGNLNNDIGLPLTLCRLGAVHRDAVIEMGANHPGEIAWLTELAEPHVAIITNAAPAHLEGFGSLEGVARAKGEIFAGLDETGTAVINADDDFAPLWRELAGSHGQLSFGLRRPADVTAGWQATATGSHLVARTPAGELELVLPLPGEHNVMNALAAIAAAVAIGIPLADIKAGLEAVQAVPGRLQSRAGRNGSRIVDDTYNANPASLAAALRVLGGFDGRHVLVLGEMGELGAETENLHAAAGRLAREAGVDCLVTVGPMAAAAAEAFGANAQACANHAEAISAVNERLGPAVTVLVKGSRLSHMEAVVNGLQEGGAD
jgi:UDP-N-acetylmuramoyl-tripeptide--D-alanyl-D-alanine ligase